MAGGARTARHRLAEAVSGNRAVADRDLRQTTWRRCGWLRGEALLRRRISRDRNRPADRRAAPGWPRHADPYPKSDGIPEHTARQAANRAPVPAARGGLPSE